MGQTPPKYFLPSSPYGASPGANTVNPTQPGAVNPQQPLLPPNFQDPGTIQQQIAPTTGQGAMPRPTNNPMDYRQLMQGLFRIAILLLLPFSTLATTTVTGKVQNLGTANITSGTFVRFWLRGCGGNQPRINGTSVIGPSQGGVFYFDIAADSSGNIAGTIYSTRDATGLLGGDIECGGSKLSVWYGMQVWNAGKAGPEVPIHAQNGITLDITQVTPITANPVVAAGQNGDSTYARLDGGNSPFLGNVGFSGQMNANAGGALKGTFIGNPEFTGSPTADQLNNVIFVDGVTYPLTAIGIQGAINAASNSSFKGGTVVLPPTGGPNAPFVSANPPPTGNPIPMGSTTITLPSNVCLKGAGPGFTTTLRWSAQPTGTGNSGVLMAKGTFFACVQDLTLDFASGFAAEGIRIQGDSVGGFATQYNTIKNVTVFIEGGSPLTQTIGIHGSGTGAPADISLNFFTQIQVWNAGQFAICNHCEGNHWEGSGANLGYANSTTLFPESNVGDEIINVRLNSNSTYTSLVCYSDDATSLLNLVWLSCDNGTASSTALLDAGNANAFWISMNTGVALGTLSATSRATALNPNSTLQEFIPNIFCKETTAPSGLAGSDVFYCDSTAHWPFVNPNNTGLVKLLAAGNGANNPMQTKRVAGCATAASLNATCDTTVTWTSAFADANYTATCTGDVVTSGVPIIEGIDISAAKVGASITVRTISITAAAAQFTTIDCMAVHD